MRLAAMRGTIADQPCPAWVKADETTISCHIIPPGGAGVTIERMPAVCLFGCLPYQFAGQFGRAMTLLR